MLHDKESAHPLPQKFNIAPLPKLSAEPVTYFIKYLTLVLRSLAPPCHDLATKWQRLTNWPFTRQLTVLVHSVDLHTGQIPCVLERLWSNTHPCTGQPNMVLLSMVSGGLCVQLADRRKLIHHWPWPPCQEVAYSIDLWSTHRGASDWYKNWYNKWGCCWTV